jgi:hypothetical protein
MYQVGVVPSHVHPFYYSFAFKRTTLSPLCCVGPDPTSTSVGWTDLNLFRNPTYSP